MVGGDTLQPARHGSWIRAVLAAVACSVASTFSAASLHLGPAWDTFPLTLMEGRRTEAWGPFFAREESEDGTLTRFSPLFSNVEQPELERSEWDFLYPVATYDRFGSEYRWQFLQLFSFAGGKNMDGDIKDRTTLFPFYFRQKSSNPTNDYFALLPIYGHMRNHLLRDEVRFLLAPLWLQTRKRDVVTDNYLVPFFHLRHGYQLSGWQLWPIYGHETRKPGIRTNSLDLMEIVPGHERRFIAWPFGFFNHDGIGTDNPVQTRSIIPLFSTVRSPLRDNTVLLWPFLSHTVDRGKKYSEWGLPYPFIGWATGEGKEAFRMWPLYGRAAISNKVQNFALWPLYVHNHSRASNLDRERTRLLFFGYDDLRQSNPATGAEKRHRNLWPLFTWRKELNGNERLQIIAPVEPVLPNNKTIERLHSPLWSLYRSENNPSKNRSSQSLLWNLWRREVDNGTSQTRFLFGLVQTRRNPDGDLHFGFFHSPRTDNQK